METLWNCDEVSRDDEELEKIFSKHAQGRILRTFTLQTVCSQVKLCMFRVVVGTEEKCLAKSGNKLFFEKIQLVFVNHQCFANFIFQIKNKCKQEQEFSIRTNLNCWQIFSAFVVVLEEWSGLQNMTCFPAAYL